MIGEADTRRPERGGLAVFGENGAGTRLRETRTLIKNQEKKKARRGLFRKEGVKHSSGSVLGREARETQFQEGNRVARGERRRGNMGVLWRTSSRTSACHFPKEREKNPKVVSIISV